MKANRIILQAVMAMAVGVALAKPVSKSIQVEAKKTPSDQWKSYPTRTLAEFAEVPLNPPLDPYGGLLANKSAATGFFRTEKVADRWWLIDPEGGRYFNVGLATLYPYVSANHRDVFQAKYGDGSGWVESTVALLKEHGFNGAGAWSDVTKLRQAKNRLVYTVLLDLMTGYAKKRGASSYLHPGQSPNPSDCIFVFDPEFAEFCDEQAARIAANKDDPWLLGYFSDNELPFFRLPFFQDALDKFLAMPESHPGHQAAKTWLAQRRSRRVSDTDRMDFLGFMAERYYQITTQAIRKYDPNHLCLGSRFWETDLTRPELWAAAGKYLDVVSVNYYHAWTPQPEQMAMWTQAAGKPFLVTECYVKGMDSGLPNNSGAGWCVKTQGDRGLFYQNFALGLLEARGCVGWHWFRYMDNDPAAKGPNSGGADVDSNKGIVTVGYEPYAPLLNAMKALNERVYPLISQLDKTAPTTRRKASVDRVRPSKSR